MNRVRLHYVWDYRDVDRAFWDEHLAGNGVNFNALVGSVEDPDSGLDAAWGIRAKLKKA